MEFTESILKKLYECIKKKTLVKIEGKNGAGQSFKVEGLVESLCNNSEILVNLGQDKYGNKYLAPFYSVNLIGNEKLYINKITNDNELIFENRDFNKIINENRFSRNRDNLSYSLSIRGKKFAEFIGKPVIIDIFGEKPRGVLTQVGMKNGTKVFGNIFNQENALYSLMSDDLIVDQVSMQNLASKISIKEDKIK